MRGWRKIHRKKTLICKKEEAEIADGHNSFETEHNLAITSTGCPKIVQNKQRSEITWYICGLVHGCHNNTGQHLNPNLLSSNLLFV